MEKWVELKKTAIKYWEHYNKDKIVEYIGKNCKEEVEELIRQADMLLNQTFVFQDKWDMEPCRTPYTMSMDTWVESPNGDEEWVFMLNRHDFLLKLWYAFLFTDDEKYVAKLRWYMFDWIAKNPITEKGTDATRTIDTGIRCMNWCGLILPMYAIGIINEKETEQLLDVLNQQILNMRKRYIGKYSLSNWGVLQTTAICVAYTWYREFLAEEIEEWAWNELANQLEMQILDDGAHWEQSAMYHVEVLNSISKVLQQIVTAKELGTAISDAAEFATEECEEWTSDKEAFAKPGAGYEGISNGWLVNAVRVLGRHVLHTVDPEGNQLAQCDSDVTNIKDVMVRTSLLLSGGEIYRYMAGPYMDMDSAWQFGEKGILKFEKTQGIGPKQLIWNGTYCGNINIRSSWDKDANYTWVKNSALGSAHGHADQGHMTIYLQGKPFLVDSGRYTYREDDPLRMILKNPNAHNVCVIDGESGGNADTSWTYDSYGEVGKNYFESKKGVHFIEMPSYGTLKNGLYYGIIRRVMILDDGVWISVQDIMCNGEHEAVEYFHLDDKVKVEQNEDRICLRNENVVLNMYCEESIIEKNGIISKKYNELLEAAVLEKHAAFENRYISAVVFADEKYKIKPVEVYQYGKEQPVPKEIVKAWDVESSDGLQWTIVIWNSETYRGGKMYYCHGVPVYGKAIAIRWQGENYQRIRIKN